MYLDWHSMRVGYFWGGDGETHLKINSKDLCMKFVTPAEDFIVFVRPFCGNMDFKWHVPKDQKSKQNNFFNCKFSEINTILSMTQIRYITNLRDLIQSDLNNTQNNTIVIKITLIIILILF